MSREIPKYIKYVAADPNTASEICNDLYPDEPERIGKIYKDYVNFFLYEDSTLTETDCDRYEHFVRNKLAADAIRLRAHAKEVSDIRAESGRKGGKAKSDGKDYVPDPTDSDTPDEIVVIDYVHAKKYDPNVAAKWLEGMINSDWKDENGLPIRDWRKRLDSYMKSYNKKRLESMANGMCKG